jgi:hypothetical protein
LASWLPGNEHDIVLPAAQTPPQVVPLPAQAARVPCGCPEVTGEHLPSVAGMSHAWQEPAHGSSQQTPSWQTLLVHCELLVHDEPFARVPHDPAEQVPVVLHWPAPLPVQLVWHAVAPELQR